MSESRERRVHFNKLPADVRKRLVEVMKGVGDPDPILADRRSLAGAMVGWVLLALVGAVILVGSVWWGFAEPWEDGAVQGPLMGVVYVAGAFTLVGGLLGALARVLMDRALPYPMGRYLLPMDYVEAFGPVLRIVPMAERYKVGGTHHHKNGVYTHTQLDLRFEGGYTIHFTVKGKMLAEQVLHELGTTGKAVNAAIQSNDLGSLAGLDPFLEARLGEVWASLDDQAPPRRPEGPAAGNPRFTSKLAWIAALVLGLLVGPPVLLVRNIASDELMYAELSETSSTWDCESYLRHGWRHKDEVRDVFLPAAAFRSAKNERSVGAIREFMAEYPGSVHEDDARAAIHELYEEARLSFEERASTDNPQAVPFMATLLAWLETHDDPAVEVRFLAPSSEALTEVDALIKEKGAEIHPGPMAPVSPNFTDSISKARESGITKMLQEGFGQVFSSDVLVLQEGERLADADWDAPVTKPTILVSYALGASGAVYTSNDSDCGYVGIIVDFWVSMRVPDSTDRIELQLTVEPPDQFTVGGGYLSSYMAASEMSDSSVYSTMALRAFDKLGAQVRRALFKEGVGDVDGGGSSAGGLNDLGDAALSPADLEELRKLLEEIGYPME